MSNDWQGLADVGTKIVGLEYHLCDRNRVLTQFYLWGQQRELPVYFWNPGFESLQQVINKEGQCILHPSDWVSEKDVSQFLLKKDTPGIYLLEGLLELDASGAMSERRVFELTNAHYQFSWGQETREYWVLLDTYIQLPLDLQPLIPVLSTPLPRREEVQQMVAQFCQGQLGLSSQDNLEPLVRACLGLPSGEIDLVLERSLASSATVADIAQLVLTHKVQKLRGRGLEFISFPDVPDAGGLDLLAGTLLLMVGFPGGYLVSF